MDTPDDYQPSNPSTEGLRSLGLRVPQQAPASPDSFLLDAKATNAWFSALPMANIGETARQIFNALVDCNRMEMSQVIRARVTEQFREPVAYLCKNLERHYVDLGMPLSAKGRKTVSLALELQSELAVGYKIIIEGLLSGDPQHFDEKLLVIALHRALYHLGQVLFQSALAYGPWPAGVWREINGIYAYAAQNQVHGVPVKDSLDGAKGRGNTIEDLYKALTIFAASDPLRLRQTYSKQVYSEAMGWGRQVQIRPAAPEDNAAGLFNIDLLGDLPPVHNTLRSPTENRRGRIIDLRALVRSLREEFERQQGTEKGSNGGEVQLSRPLYRQLIATWTKPPERRFMRTHLNFELHLAVGLSALYSALQEPEPAAKPRGPLQSGDRDPAQSMSPRVPTWAAGIRSDSLSLAPPELGLAGAPVPRSTIPAPNEPQAQEASNDWAKNAAPEVERPPHPANTINESAGGYCIRWTGEQTPRVKVGDVIGIQSASNPKQFGVGLIRWLKQDPARDLEVGLEILTPRCRSAELRIASASPRRSQQPRYPCVLLPETNRGAGDTSLLTSAEGLQGAPELWLHSGGEEQMITLTRLIEFTGTVSRYAYAQVEPKEEPPSEDSGRREFDDLWSSL